MRRGEIWRVSLDPISGREQAGLRPVFIISPDQFNRATRCPIILPITTGGNFARFLGFVVPLEGRNLLTDGVIRCDQPRALDLNARDGRLIEMTPHDIIEDVLAKVSVLLS